jgi:hypothetical protein
LLRTEKSESRTTKPISTSGEGRRYTQRQLLAVIEWRAWSLYLAGVQQPGAK